MVPSPCQQLCVLDPASNHCVGCGRSSAEIAAWTRLDDGAKQIIVDALPERIETMKSARIARHGARRGRSRRAPGSNEGNQSC